MRFAAAALTLLLNTGACAAEIEGIDVPARVRLGTGGPELVLNGAGVRVRLIFKVYVAALYLPAKTADAEAILQSDRPTRFVLRMLRDVTAAEINSSVNDALRETLTPAERQPLEARMTRFNAIFETLREVKSGTRITLDFVALAGTVISINAEEKDRIPGADFNRALLRVWLGERARDPALRKALLGSSAQ